MRARCQCGQLTADVPGPSDQVVACHCAACQRRTGSPFGVLAYYPAEQVTLAGPATRYTRPTDAGRDYTIGFCPICGTALFGYSEQAPARIGVAVGAFDPPHQPAPHRSVWEDNRHPWVAIPGDIPHFPKGRTA